MAITDSTTSLTLRLGATSTDTYPVHFDSLLAGIMEASLGRMLPQMLGQQKEEFERFRPLEGLTEQRLQNKKFYDIYKNEIDSRFEGRIVVIANGAIVTVADSFEAVVDAASDVEHRLVFRAGGKAWRKRKMRLPISRK